MWIKICGNTNLEDVHMVADSGATPLASYSRLVPPRHRGHVAAMMPELPTDLTRSAFLTPRISMKSSSLCALLDCMELNCTASSISLSQTNCAANLSQAFS